MRKRFLLGLVAAAVVVGIVFAKRHELLRFVFETAASAASGYTVRYDDQRIGPDHAALLGVRVSRGGYPLLDARRIDVWYSLRDLLPGSSHRFGLVGIAIDGAKLTLVHFRDGTFNLNIPSAAPPSGPRIPQRVDPVPLQFYLRMSGAQLDLLEPYAYDVSAKRIQVRGFTVAARIDSGARSHYDAHGTFVVRRAKDPFTIAGTIDAQRGYAMHHAHAPFFPLRALANYFADTPALRVLAGRARNFDARAYSLDVRPNVAGTYHVNLQLDLDSARMSFESIADPIENIRGHLQLVDNDVFVRGMTADLAGVPMRVTGGLYDLSSDLTGSAQLRVAVDGTGDLDRLRNAFTFTRTQPIGGVMSLGVLIEGPLGDPTILAHGYAAHAFYREMPFDRLDAHVVYRDGRVALAPLEANYAGTRIGVRGYFDVSGPHVLSRMALHVAADGLHLPYLDEMLGNEPLLLDAVASGTDLLFHADGALASARGVQRVAALVRLEPNGTGSVEPFWLHTQRGDLDGGYLLDRPHHTSAFWAIAGNLDLHAPRYKAFPGVELPQIPAIDGRLDAFSVAGGGDGQNVAIAGDVLGGKSDFAGVHFDRIEAAFGGTMSDAAVNRIVATGPWGSFTGNGAFSTQAFVARGAYRGTLEGLQPFLGSAIPGHGPIAGNAAIAVAGDRIVVQGDRLRMPGATLRGIPVSQASLTLAVDGDTLDVYSAHALAAGGDVVAAGRFSVAARPRALRAPLGVVANRLKAAQLHGIGLPIDAGTLDASGTLAAGAPLPSYRGGVTIVKGHLLAFPVEGNAQVDLAGDAVRLTRTIGALGSTYAFVDGSIGALSSGAPSYALAADVPAADVASALHTLDVPNFMTQGVFDARLRIDGRGAQPFVRGTIGVPGGDVNGLPFVDGSGSLEAATSGVSLHHGRVLVGTTYLHFAAIAQPQENAVHLKAVRTDLADFNNFFDTGDTLAGKGSVALAAAVRGERISTSGDLAITGFRYRNLPIGNLRGTWSSSNNEIKGAVAIGGEEGALDLRGTIGLAPSRDPVALVERSRYDLAGSVDNLDLSLWAPALGFHSVPITGRAFGRAQLRGRYPALSMQGTARVDGGTLGPLTLERARIAVHSSGARVIVDDSQLETTGLTAAATGSFGLRPSDKLDLSLHAATDDLPRLVFAISRVRIPVSGTFESTVQVGGTLHAPTFAAGFDASGVSAYGVTIASAFGEVSLHGTTVVLSNAGATFTKGQATIAGSVPLQLSPLRIGPADQPISFDLDVVDLDPGIFDAVLGSNTVMGGTINGHVALSGTVGQPHVLGRVDLAGGSYVSDLEREPITATVASLAFSQTSLTIDRFSAKVGTGSVSASGALHFPGGFTSAGSLAFALSGHADGAQLNLPAYGSGTLDARLALEKDPSGTAKLAGTVALSNASLPFSAFISAAQQAQTPGGPPIPLAFDLQASAGKNVRVRGNGYGAGLDIGATGSVHLGGTLKAPTLSGSFNSTGGTLTYFDRAFRVRQGAVTFDPADGLIPTIHAVGATNVVNPDPDRARNPYGSADITISVDGQINALKIVFNSNPPGYTREQILAMIAPFGGFVNGIGFSSATALQAQTPSGVPMMGAVQPIPGIYVQRTNGTVTVGQEAFNILNAQFAAGLLGPVENVLGEGLGLSSVNLTLGYYGNVGFAATKELGKQISAVYSVTFGLPQIQSFGLQYAPSANTTATLSLFTQTGPTPLFTTSGGYVAGLPTSVAGQPLVGNNGFSFNLRRFF
ncbi:MAG TPA: translocation/assembly module TamB domain-containing protein [Verrucomicrobiae bacterium]|nr:translocation/assembly module TamB domain-containing protein [Verrucomicrobiae bacterium]